MFERRTIKLIQEPSVSCLSIEQLFALAQNQLPAGEVERIRVHLITGCDACREQLDQLQKMLAATASCELLEPPGWLIHQARSLFSWHKTGPGESRRERIPAILLVDNFADGRLLGFRGTGPMSRQMLYRAGDYNIDLSIDYVEQPQAIDIMGQAMPLSADLKAVAGAGAKLLIDSLVAFSTKTNEFGEFIFDGIPEGLYDLKLELEEEEIDIIQLSAVFRPHERRAVN